MNGDNPDNDPKLNQWRRKYRGFIDDSCQTDSKRVEV